jgi:hypothetical protein
LVWKQLRLIRQQIDLVREQIDLLRQQATTSFEDSLTAHYRRIMESIPTNIWLGGGLNTLDEVRQNLCRDAIYRYIDLCQEQTVLHDENRIADSTWKQWGDGIRSNMKILAFQQVWNEVKTARPDNFLELAIFLLS